VYVPKPAEEEEVRRVLIATGRRAATSDDLGLTASSSKEQRGMHASEQRYREHGTNKSREQRGY